MSLDRLTQGLSRDVAAALDRALAGHSLSVDEAVVLLRAQGGDLLALMRAADIARIDDKGDVVTYVVNRNLNFTNVCYVGCSYCGFSRHKDDEDAYDHDMETLVGKTRQAVDRGATEVCIQGGIHPNKDHTHYREILLALKGAFPQLHIHAFSPEEIDHGHRQSGMPLETYLAWLKEAGLGTIPGTAAEILDDEIRQILAPRKLMTDRWVEIVRAAHRVGLRSTATVMYGHIEEVEHVARHFNLIRNLQRETGGFTEFVPLGFIHSLNRLFQEMGARPGSSTAEDLRLIAVARLFLRPEIVNIQMSWVKMGTKMAQMALLSGANDFGGTLMEESISRESGADHGENLPPERIRQLVREMGRVPAERNTAYETLRTFEDPSQDPPSQEPASDAKLSGPSRWSRKRSNGDLLQISGTPS